MRNLFRKPIQPQDVDGPADIEGLEKLFTKSPLQHLVDLALTSRRRFLGFYILKPSEVADVVSEVNCNLRRAEADL